ncbi:MAG: manganese efflux pump MntP family protein [Christensenellaceae bacterium]|jgi:putative Mn2+ efflux pump MntP|nr:manganese efflux pump MntP family protein [Christensenellaceae bacterium]
MRIFEIVIIAIGLSMDAFAVAICKGIELKKLKIKHLLIVGAYFGIFQALMPLTGHFIGTLFEGFIEKYDHWVSFGILTIVGVRTLVGAFKKKKTQEPAQSAKPDAENEKSNNNDEIATNKIDLAFKMMLPLAVATSIDALTVGVGLAFVQVNIYLSIIIIGAITFMLSALGVVIGHLTGLKFHKKAEIAGGIIIILIGINFVLNGWLYTI